ncbi:patatin-like phospholipase family protein [Streptomyces sioyaensis]|uniref:patatin-like phospholipase family protein n=1 Tax=Streptomyces sioyaensis TaxID=67364 RepID=UPI0037A81508
MHSLNRGLVLGGGGLVGTAWMAGLACGLRRDGVDLGEADLIVGTSAGAMVGVMLTTGRDLEQLAASPVRPAGPRPESDAGMGAVLAVLREPGLDPAEVRRRFGRIALDTTDPETEETLLAIRRDLIGTEAWPDVRLLITAVDAATGEPVFWDRDSGIPLVHAVTASSAFPGVAPPIAIQGRRYMDGGVRSGTNADLAAGARRLVVVEPLAHMSPREALEGELAAVGAHTVVTISPDEASLRAFGSGLFDAAAWEPAYRAGLRQAGETAERLRSMWRAAADTR